MLKILENNRMEETGLVTPTPDSTHSVLVTAVLYAILYCYHGTQQHLTCIAENFAFDFPIPTDYYNVDFFG